MAGQCLESPAWRTQSEIQVYKDTNPKIQNAKERQKMSSIGDLKFDDKNFNKHTQYGMSLLEKSLRENGAGRSILIDKDNNIIAGNGIIEAAGSIGLEKVKIIETSGDEIIAVKRTDIELDSQKGREMALADNATSAADLAWDDEAISEVSEKFGFDPGDWIADWNNSVEEIEEDEPPEVNESEPPKSEEGAVYRLGKHRLMCGDSTNIEHMEQLMGDQYADLLLTDPPYNVDYEGKTSDRLKIQNDKMENDNFRQFLRDAFVLARSAMKEGAAFYIWHSPTESYNFYGACKDAELGIRECLVWNKNQMVMGRQDYQWKHEGCLYGWKDGDAHKWYADRKQTTVLDFDKPSASEDHPTMKPVGLFSYLIQNSAAKGDFVLDIFGGSGTTLIACEQLDRVCYMMELDPKYCDVIRKRYWKLTHDGNEEGWEEGTPKI